jgi:ribosomal protein S18 acetylase RimI-like enzyme
MGLIRRLTEDDLPRLRRFWVEYWGGDQMFMHGQVVRYDRVNGFVYGDWLGLLTFILHGDECEITSLNSLREGQGIATALIDEVKQEAKENRCRRLLLITTNDNMHALGYYQRRGFELAALHRGAVNESRKLKPSIPLIGENHIPLRDEIELEMVL